MKIKQRFGVIFSGGAAGAMNATLEYLFQHLDINSDAELIGFRYGWKGLIENDIVRLTAQNTRGIGFKPGGDFLGSCSKINVFKHDPQGGTNYQDFSEVCYHTYKSHRLSAIFVLGGDGTSRQANDLIQKYPDMRFIWISATLDRDIAACEDTIGFHTAVENAAEGISAMHLDGKTMRRHTIIECMGRESGYVTAYAVALASRQENISIDIVLVPEIEFNIKAIRDRVSQSNSPVTIVISEGIKIPEEELIAETTVTSEPSSDGKKGTKSSNVTGHHPDLAYTCNMLEALLKPFSNMPIKSERIGYRQRCGELSGVDSWLAEQSAALAVKSALNDKESKAIIYREYAFQSILLPELVRQNKKQSSKDSKFQKFLSDPNVCYIQDELSSASKEVVFF